MSRVRYYHRVLAGDVDRWLAKGWREEFPSRISIPSLDEEIVMLTKDDHETDQLNIDREIDEVIAFGAKKHGDPPGERAWRSRPTEPEESYQAAMRHLKACWRGETADPETGKHPLAHVAARLRILFDLAQQKKDEDGEPIYESMANRSD